MSQDQHEVSYFRRKYIKFRRHLASRNLEKKLEQQYLEIMRNKKRSLSDQTYN